MTQDMQYAIRGEQKSCQSDCLDEQADLRLCLLTMLNQFSHDMAHMRACIHTLLRHPQTPFLYSRTGL